jgi:hypothetical protein
MKRIGLILLIVLAGGVTVLAIDQDQANKWKPILDALFPDLPAPWILDSGKSRYTIMNATVTHQLEDRKVFVRDARKVMYQGMMIEGPDMEQDRQMLTNYAKGLRSAPSNSVPMEGTGSMSLLNLNTNWTVILYRYDKKQKVRISGVHNSEPLMLVVEAALEDESSVRENLAKGIR